MKKTFITPKMNISVFDVENIVTSSSQQQTAETFANNMATENNINQNQIKTVKLTNFTF